MARVAAGAPMTGSGYVVGVRALCEFTAKRGDLDLRFTPAPSAQQGLAGHRIVAARRGAGYRSEVTLSGECGGLTVRGRADGYDAEAGLLEEIKTHRGDLERQPANHRHLHWAQARVYGALLCRQHGLDEIRLALVYFDVARQTETCFVESCRADDLERHFEAQCRSFVAWSAQELAHAAARDASLDALAFPHPAFRAGQRELAEGAFRAATQRRCLVAQAPTGIGKTIGTVFPVLKAWTRQRFDKVFFLTAKTAGRGLAWQAIARLHDGAAPPRLRTVELVGREQACEHPDKACHGESCPLARGFYDRLPAARAAAFSDAGPLDPTAVRALAREHSICPYYLGQELVRWADVVIADYNHYFDSSALLHALAIAQEWNVAVLVDEAHNLPERARAMYSAELRRSTLQALRRSAPGALGPALARLGRRWSELLRGQDTAHRSFAEVPAPFVNALREAGTLIVDHLAESPAGTDAALLDFHFAALQFLRLVETFGDHSVFDLALDTPGRTGRRADSVIGVRNLIPAPHLERRFAAASSTLLFSATLTPLRFYRDTLGLPADTAWLDVPSPFSAGQLALRVARDVSTRWSDRERSLAPIARLIAAQYAAAPGNYLAFFSSFEYLEKALAQLVAIDPAVPVWQQSRGMTAGAREAFLARFVEGGRGVGFAVLGGSFGEAIDLPGTRLVGAFVATLGMPPPGPLNELMRERTEAAFGAGYDYTYLIPGIQKVVQAVGRVIRTPEDAGVVHLIDDRFDRPAVRRLFPRWWRIEAAALPGPVGHLTTAGVSGADPRGSIEGRARRTADDVSA
jgi:DNA excision repair protein ERCC-2